MPIRSRYDLDTTRKTCKEKTIPPQSGDDCRAHSGSRTKRECCRDLPPRKHCAEPLLPVATESPRRDGLGPQTVETGPQGQGHGKGRPSSRERAFEGSTLRSDYRTSIAQKKRELGLHGSLKGRHLRGEYRKALLEAILKARADGETMSAICNALELNRRTVYRWMSGKAEKPHHGGGGGLNKIRPLEEKRIVALAKRYPHFRCRRIAYELERRAKAFVGKTKVAEVLKKHGLNHEFVRGDRRKDDPSDMLMHEPRAKNLVWGTDWSWVRVDGRFMFLLVIIDWYSRKIVSWGLFRQITSFEVVAVITDAVAIEKIDLLPEGQLKPRIIADHGSANISRYTRSNIEVQGLELWLSGVGRPTGNARTERVIGTLKHEEIKLQDQYASEVEARQRIGRMVWDYNFRRPNAGNGGFAPNSVHHMGRSALMERRKAARKQTAFARRSFWKEAGHE